MGQKFEILNFEIEEKLDDHFCVKFCGKSNSDSLEAQKPSSGPKKAHLGWLLAQKSKF